jgi:hypothetical protein
MANISIAGAINLFYSTVGQGISFWAIMEGRLVQIAAKLLKSPDERTGLVMYSILNFHIWLQVIDDLFVMDGTYKQSHKLWRGVIDDLKKENDIRARLAHHTRRIDGAEKDPRKGITLRPSPLDRRTKSQKFTPLTADDIVSFTERVTQLSDKLDIILQTMEKSESSR